MLRIGEFSRLSRVTVKTLHYYDEVGLLKPARIDPLTNHRYYTTEQLPRIHRIMALKGLGLSLDQIGLMLLQAIELTEVRGMLRLKQAEVEQRLRDDQAQLAAVQFHLHMLEAEQAWPELDVVVKEVAPVNALTLRTSLQRDQMISLGIEFERALAEHNLTLVGPVMELRYEEVFEEGFDDVEYVLPIGDRNAGRIALETLGELRQHTIAGLPAVASVIHRGVHTQPHQEKMALLQRWIVASGYKLGGTNRVIHHHGPFEHAEYKDWITEIQHEIIPAER